MRYLCVFGKPVDHSLSPLMHNYAINKLGLEGCYGRIAVDDGKELIERFKRFGLHGANITVPHKEAVIPYLEEMTPSAKKIGAVNTLYYKNGRLTGDNTDWIGFYKAVTPLLQEERKLLILGAGGTAKAGAYACKEHGLEFAILNRSERDREYFESLGGRYYTHKDSIKEQFPLIANTTSAGLKDANLPAPQTQLNPLLEDAFAAFDAIYKETPFLSLAKSKNLEIKNGLDMLIYQGAAAFCRFFEEMREESVAKLMHEITA